MLGDTHHLLKRFRQNGYITIQTLDSERNVIWEVFSRSKEPSYRFAGVVAPINPMPWCVGPVVFCLGRPWFHVAVGAHVDPDACERAVMIARKMKRGGFLAKMLPSRE